MQRSIAARSFGLLLVICVTASFASADWKADANARIEKLRKGDFTIACATAKAGRWPGR